MSKKYVLALDQGTTSSRAILFDHAGQPVGIAQHPFRQIYPKPGWVEHDPREIASSQLGVITEVLVSSGVSPEEIDSIGITNQRETTVVWNRETGAPIANAIVWQCRRTTDIVEEVCARPGVRELIQAKTGLIPDAYFSASKIVVAARPCPRGSRGGRGRQACVWHGRYVAHLAAHGWSSACD